MSDARYSNTKSPKCSTTSISIHSGLLMPVFQVVAFSGTYAGVTQIPGFPTDRSVNWYLPMAVTMGASFAGLGTGFSMIRDRRPVSTIVFAWRLRAGDSCCSGRISRYGYEPVSSSCSSLFLVSLSRTTSWQRSRDLQPAHCRHWNGNDRHRVGSVLPTDSAICAPQSCTTLFSALPYRRTNPNLSHGWVA